MGYASHPRFYWEEIMIEFVSGCTGLFTSTFDAAAGQDFFLLLLCYLVVHLGFGFFYYLRRGFKKM